MNASRLKELIDFMLKLESEYQIQNQLTAATNNLNGIVQEPQQPQHQTQFSEALAALQAKSVSLREMLEPGQIALLDEIGASQFFVDDLSAQISYWMQNNPLTPVVTQKNLNEFKAKRQEYIRNITQLRDSLQAIGIQASVLQPGDAEIGILLPRPLFDNKFEQLIKELDHIKFMLRAFSELATGAAEPIEVRQISSSNPLFFLGISPETIAMVAGAVTWALHTWKQVEEIRNVRAETAKLTEFTEEEVDSIFGKKINKTIENAVNDKLDDLLEGMADKKGRAKEQRSHLKIALEWLLARIERGVTIEVRFLPPPKTALEEGKPPDIPQAFKTLQDITTQLVFPKIEGTPILNLPDLNNTEDDK